jgi:hypothetical protein
MRRKVLLEDMSSRIQNIALGPCAAEKNAQLESWEFRWEIYYGPNRSHYCYIFICLENYCVQKTHRGLSLLQSTEYMYLCYSYDAPPHAKNGAHAKGLEGAQALGLEGKPTGGTVGMGVGRFVVGQGVAFTVGLRVVGRGVLGFDVTWRVVRRAVGFSVTLVVGRAVVGLADTLVTVGAFVVGLFEFVVGLFVGAFVVGITVGAFNAGFEVAGAGVATLPPQLAGGFADKIQIC